MAMIRYLQHQYNPKQPHSAPEHAQVLYCRVRLGGPVRSGIRPPGSRFNGLNSPKIENHVFTKDAGNDIQIVLHDHLGPLELSKTGVKS